MSPLHHTLPATYLALFSNAVASPRRDSVVVVGNKRTTRTFPATAGSIGAVRGLYTVLYPQEDPERIERMWQGYETQLAHAVEALVNGSIRATTWATVLVPFVAALLVRGQDFTERFEQRIGPIAGHVRADNTNHARLFELQRLVGPVLAARWLLMTAIGSDSLITNDGGYAPFMTPQGELGMAVPLGHRYVLGLVPRRAGAIVSARQGEWRPVIERGQLTPGNHLTLNTALAQRARRFVFGADEATVVASLRRVDRSCPPALEPQMLGFLSGPLAAVHEFTWHRLVSGLAKSPGHPDAGRFDVDWTAIAASAWTPQVMLPTNLPRFPSSLKRYGNYIYVNLCDAVRNPNGDWLLALPLGWTDPSEDAIT
ncbi:MAG TPA: DUF4238 domain-containing protein [Ktedonobacterales bacterium]|nr:DUF4238 domain-containing protein [Ktedonobacterales bacterium]